MITKLLKGRWQKLGTGKGSEGGMMFIYLIFACYYYFQKYICNPFKVEKCIHYSSDTINTDY